MSASPAPAPARKRERDEDDDVDEGAPVTKRPRASLVYPSHARLGAIHAGEAPEEETSVEESEGEEEASVGEAPEEESEGEEEAPVEESEGEEEASTVSKGSVEEGVRDMPLCGDALACYSSVHTALQRLRHATVLGTVLNGATVCHEDDEEVEEERAEASGLQTWGVALGCQLAAAAELSAFVCSGTVGIANTLYDGNRIEHVLRVWRNHEKVAQWPLHAIPIDALLPFCTPAAFGDLKTQTTVVDLAVRTAFELSAVVASGDGGGGDGDSTGFRFDIVWLVNGEEGSRDPAFLGAAHKEVRKRLVPSRTAALVPYKLNVYGKGGFFKAHVDTPTLDSAAQVGTLVVALPSAFEGGVLRVQAPSGSAPSDHTTPTVAAELDWAPLSSGIIKDADEDAEDAEDADEDQRRVVAQWAAFFSDCVHEVAPVTGGSRLTLTYGIVEGVPSNTFDHYAGWLHTTTRQHTAEESAEVHLAQLRRLVEARPAEAATFGILLSHKYTFTGIEGGVLKGVDADVHATLKAMGLQLTLRPVVYHSHIEGRFPGGSHDDDDSSATNIILAFGTEDLRVLRGGGKPTGQSSDIPFVRFHLLGYGRVSSSTSLGILLKSDHVAACEFTGNSAECEQDDCVYFAAALIVSPLAVEAVADAVAAAGAGASSN